MNKEEILTIKNRILNGGHIRKEEAMLMIQTPHQQDFYAAANEIRKKMLGNKFDLCSIENARSGYKNSCV